VEPEVRISCRAGSSIQTKSPGLEQLAHFVQAQIQILLSCALPTPVTQCRPAISKLRPEMLPRRAFTLSGAPCQVVFGLQFFAGKHRRTQVDVMISTVFLEINRPGPWRRVNGPSSITCSKIV